MGAKEDDKFIEQVPEPLRTTLRDYLHVEWHELDELALDVKRSEWTRKHESFKAQLREAIAGETLQIQAIKVLTGQEFENQVELNQWLKALWTTLYDEPL
jgi:hypothetical protein